MQLINENGRSTTDPSKEELQSQNEKLLARNAALEAKIIEVERLNSSLQKVIDVAATATVILDTDLHVAQYTPQVEDILDIGDNGVGRRLDDLPHQLDVEDFASHATRVFGERMTIEREAQHAVDERRFLIRFRPHVGPGGALVGVVITFDDVTLRKQRDARFEALVGTLKDELSARGDQMKRVAEDLLIAEQTERQRIAQILHDDVQQLLCASQMRILAITPTLPEDHASNLIDASGLIDRVIDVTGHLTTDLSPPVLETEDVGVTLEWLALRMQEMHKLQVDVACASIPAPPELRVLVYQVARELLFNVVKHAGTDRVRLKLFRADEQLVLEIADEGLGFDVATASRPEPTKGGRYGLDSVRRRIDHVGGHLELKAAPGEGTQATLFLPLGGADLTRRPPSRSTENHIDAPTPCHTPSFSSMTMKWSEKPSPY